jgi:transcriptional regulator with XRE-family HTH domain
MELLRLKELLKERGITGKEFAEAMGVSTNTASNLITGKSFPAGKDLKAIADYLQLDIRELFYPTMGNTGEPLYVERDGKYMRVGEIDLKRLEVSSIPKGSAGSIPNSDEKKL